MARPRASHEPKVKVGISLDPVLHAWAVARVGEGRMFATMTHAIERGLARLRDEEEATTARAKRRR